jgi:hypothetical protein
MRLSSHVSSRLSLSLAVRTLSSVSVFRLIFSDLGEEMAMSVRSGLDDDTRFWQVVNVISNLFRLISQTALDGRNDEQQE